MERKGFVGWGKSSLRQKGQVLISVSQNFEAFGAYHMVAGETKWRVGGVVWGVVVVEADYAFCVFEVRYGDYGELSEGLCGHLVGG